MTQILKQYGMVFIEIIAIILITVIILSKISIDINGNGVKEVGIRDITAEMVKETQPEYKSIDYVGIDNEEYDNVPTITYNNSNGISAASCKIGETIYVSNLISAIDADGNTLNVVITKVQYVKDSIDGDLEDEADANYDSTAGTIVFSEPGIYEITVTATDAKKRSAEKIIRIPVMSKS